MGLSLLHHISVPHETAYLPRGVTLDAGDLTKLQNRLDSLSPKVLNKSFEGLDGNGGAGEHDRACTPAERVDDQANQPGRQRASQGKQLLAA